MVIVMDKLIQIDQRIYQSAVMVNYIITKYIRKYVAN